MMAKRRRRTLSNVSVVGDKLGVRKGSAATSAGKGVTSYVMCGKGKFVYS
jgi:hypothetical protein